MINIAAGFAERGFATDLVLACAVGPLLANVPRSVRLVDLKSGRVLRAFGRLRSYLKRERPAVLIAALNHANVVAAAAAHAARPPIRTIISIHNHLSKELEVDTGARDRVTQWLHGYAHRWSDGIVAVSNGVADDFAHTTGVPRHCIRVIYNPVVTPDLLRAATEPPSHPWFEDPSRPLVLGVGRLTTQKNFPDLVDAFALLKRDYDAARLVILGEGPELETIQARVRCHQLEDSVDLPGFVHNPYACMARASVMALSSRWEGLPTVLIESLAIGTPVVATDCPSGPREILQNGALGTLVPPADVPAFASALAKAIGAGRVKLPPEAIRPFLPDVVLDQYVELCRLSSSPMSATCYASHVTSPPP